MKLMKHSKRLVSTSAQIVLRASYETAYGIYNHDSAEGDHPLALVMHNWAEDNIVGGRLRERMEAFARNGVGKHFHMSFEEFINQPPYVCDMMLEVCEYLDNIESDTPEMRELRRMAQEASKAGK